MYDIPTHIKKISRRKRGSKPEESKKIDDICPEMLADMEYTLNLKKYLTEAIVENEKVNKKDFFNIKSGEY